jgi:hypothetical protein
MMKGCIVIASAAVGLSLAIAAVLHQVSREYHFEPTDVERGREVQAPEYPASSSTATPDPSWMKLAGMVRVSGSLEPGDVQVQAIFLNPVQEEMPEKLLVFQLIFDSMGTDLRGLDITKRTILRNSKGGTIPGGYTWQQVHTHGHYHLMGLLAAPDLEGGESLVGEDVEWIELVIRGLPGNARRTFRWQGFHG